MAIFHVPSSGQVELCSGRGTGATIDVDRSNLAMIFSRRSIQRLLDELRPVLGDGVVADFATKLNKPGLRRLADMWEVAVLHALSRLGHIDHHVPLESGRCPDVRFNGPNGVAFTADITTVSDEGLHEHNPYREFSDVIEEEKRRIGLGIGGVYVTVYERRETLARGTKRTLRLPPRSKLRDYVRRVVLPELQRQLDEKRWPLAMRVDDETAGFELTIRDGPMSGGGYGAYDRPTVLTSNPLYNALKSKADQLRGATGLVGIFVCDGHCASLTTYERGWGQVTTDQIVAEFLRQRSSINFVVSFTVGQERTSSWLHREQPSHIVHRIWARALGPNDHSVLEAIGAQMPKPVNMPINAVHRAQESGFGRAGGGYNNMSSRGVELSVRDVMEALAGRITVAELNERLEWAGPGPTTGRARHRNPFDRALTEGRLLEGAEVTVSGEEDHDNSIRFRFGEADPAISPFR